MKNKRSITLLQKTSKAFILISVLLILFSTPVLYFFISKLMEQEVEEELYSRSYRLEHYATENGQLIELPPVFEIVKTPRLRPEILKDTLIYDPSQDETELFRELSTFRTINGEIYRITVRSMVVETQEIVVITLVYFLISLALVFVIQFYFSRAWNRRIWKPFFRNLEAMQHFSLQAARPVELVDSNIVEFSELKTEIETLTSRVIYDYNNLKEFTENISHELQTALAIMQAKLENFLNESAISDQQFEELSNLQRHIRRLANLNKKLVLLATLDQRQKNDYQEISLNDLLEEMVINFREISPVEIELEKKKNLTLFSDPELIQSLIGNLLSNAIKHTEGDGPIRITIDHDRLEISNPGDAELEDAERIFRRFYRKTERSKPGSGLGLAIVQKICEVLQYNVTYHFAENRHFFRIIFN